jgi:hypothetical protein
MSITEGGMTLRDWFAGQALANAAICDGKASDWQTAAWFGKYASGITKAQIVSKQAAEYADAMLVERAKGGL